MPFWKLETDNWKLDAKTRPTPTRTLGVRIIEDEPLADEARVVIERRPIDEPDALGIDEHLRSFRPFEHVVTVLGGRLPGKHVTQARAAASLDADAEAALREAVAHDHLVDEFAGVFADFDHCFTC